MNVIQKSIIRRLRVEGLDLCSICLEKISNRKRVKHTTRCNHHFHWYCLNEWTNTHNNCPMCRTPIKEEEPINIELDINEEFFFSWTSHNKRMVDTLLYSIIMVWLILYIIILVWMLMILLK